MRPFVALALAVIGVVFLGSIALVERLTGVGAEVASSVPARHADGQAAVPAPQVDGVPPSIRKKAAPVAASPPATPTRATVAGAPVRARAPAPQPVRDAVQMELSFRLDPRLTRSLHMGDRWVSPPTYSLAGDAKGVTVGARARLGGSAKPAPVPAWTPSEPDMVEVSPEEGDQVEITVWRAGESRLTVTSGAVSRTLTVNATEEGGALRVNISQ